IRLSRGLAKNGWQDARALRGKLCVALFCMNMIHDFRRDFGRFLLEWLIMTDPIQPPPLSNEPQGPTPGQGNSPPPGNLGMTPNTWAMLTHLSGLIGYLGNVIGSAIGPLVFWLVKKDSIPGIDAHGKEALNFNISVLIYMLIALVVTIVLSILTLGLFWFVGM